MVLEVAILSLRAGRSSAFEAAFLEAQPILSSSAGYHRHEFDVGEIYFQGIRDFQSLEGARVPRFSALMGHLFRVFEDQFYQRSEGLLDLRVWQGFEGPMDDIIAYPGVKHWWKTRCHWYSQEFQTFITDKIEQGRRPSMYREPAA